MKYVCKHCGRDSISPHHSLKGKKCHLDKAHIISGVLYCECEDCVEAREKGTEKLINEIEPPRRRP